MEPMTSFQEARTAFFDKIYTIDQHVNALQKIIESTGEPLEGNCFYEHQTLKFRNELLPKQLNLFWAGFQSKTHICEIGFNASHSALLFCMANPALEKLTIFDLFSHTYTHPTLDYLLKEFPSVSVDICPGDSKVTLPMFFKKCPEFIGIYDLVHVDGGHTEDCIANDMIFADRLVKVNGILIIDDTDNKIINSYTNKYIATGSYKEIQILETPMYSHRMLLKLH